MQAVLNKDTVEQILVGQNRWEDSVVGGVCVTVCTDLRRQRQKTQSLIRGIVKARSRRAKGSVNTSYNNCRAVVMLCLTLCASYLYQFASVLHLIL